MAMSCLFHAVGCLKTLSLLVEGHGERPRRIFFRLLESSLQCSSLRLQDHWCSRRNLAGRLLEQDMILEEGVGGLNHPFWH